MEDKGMTKKIWAERPTPFEEERYPHGIMRNPVYYRVSEMDAWLEKLKEYYSPYDELLKAEPLMPLDIKSVLAKEGMPILIDEGRFNELKEKAEKWDELPPHSDGKTYLRWKWRAERAEQKLIGATCPDCNGPLEKRTFIDTPDDTSENWWCPACRLRWLSMDFKPE